MKIGQSEIKVLERRFRTTFINSLSGFKSLFLISTLNQNATSNLAIFNSVIHIGADPPYLGYISRPDSVERHTLKNILDSGVYNLNAVSEDFYKKAHQTSARYHCDESEFKAVKLTEEYLGNCKIPFVKESPLKIEMKLSEKIDIKSNGTHLIIGEVLNIYLNENIIQEDGFIDLEKANIIAGSGLDAYHRSKLILRLAYAKPNS